MDFIERLVNNVNSIRELPLKCKIGYLGPDESLCVYSLPGGRITSSYYDGTKDQELNYEFAMKSKDQQKTNDTLWTIQNHLEQLKQLESNDKSFLFESIVITNKPFINQLDDSKYYIFVVTIQAKITTKQEETR